MRYVAPSTLEEASAFLLEANGTGRVLAGGTDLLVQLRAGVTTPGIIVDVKHIEELMTIQDEDGGFRVGAAVCGQELGEHPGVTAAWPGVVEAVELIGSTQVQGRATAGGNLCNASPAADRVPAMIAAGATVAVYGPNGRRELAVIVGRGVALTMDASGTVSAARVGGGAVAPTVLHVADADAALIGSKLDDEALERAAEACRQACNPINDKRGTVEYRTKIAGVLMKRAAKIAADRAGS